MDDAWVFWLVGGVGLSVAEMLGAEFVLLMLGGAGIAAAVAALIVPWLWLQIVIFAVAAVALLLGVRPALLRHAMALPRHRSGTDALIGSPATVLATVDADHGQVKIGGEVWSAVGIEGDRQLEPGTPVTVVEVRGATAVVISGP